MAGNRHDNKCLLRQLAVDDLFVRPTLAAAHAAQVGISYRHLRRPGHSLGTVNRRCLYCAGKIDSLSPGHRMCPACRASARDHARRT